MYAQTYGASAAFAGDATAHFGRAEASVGQSDGRPHSGGAPDGLSVVCFDHLMAPVGLSSESPHRSAAPVVKSGRSHLHPVALVVKYDRSRLHPVAPVVKYDKSRLHSSAPAGESDRSRLCSDTPVGLSNEASFCSDTLVGLSNGASFCSDTPVGLSNKASFCSDALNGLSNEASFCSDAPIVKFFTIGGPPFAFKIPSYSSFSVSTGLIVAARQLCHETAATEMTSTPRPVSPKSHQSRGAGAAKFSSQRVISR